jgi:hypothetical protein
MQLLRKVSVNRSETIEWTSGAISNMPPHSKEADEQSLGERVVDLWVWLLRRGPSLSVFVRAWVLLGECRFGWSAAVNVVVVMDHVCWIFSEHQQIERINQSDKTLGCIGIINPVCRYCIK